MVFPHGERRNTPDTPDERIKSFGKLSAGKLGALADEDAD
jgi:hypothetical protein